MRYGHKSQPKVSSSSAMPILPTLMATSDVLRSPLVVDPPSRAFIMTKQAISVGGSDIFTVRRSSQTSQFVDMMD